jgi:2-polyprenyl-3-methyl-5-hydroxy-6-metoxy-1,4-benzoquinol methylase
MDDLSKEEMQERQYHFPYHHLSHVEKGAIFTFRHLFWGLEHYTYINFVLDKIETSNHATLADIGCGEGRLLCDLAKRTSRFALYGYDISESAIELARCFTNAPIFATHDILTTPLPSKVDAVVSCEVIEHIKPEQIDQYCKNISLSLNQNGVLFLTTPTTNIPVNKKHYQHFTKTSLDSYLSPYFTINDVWYLNRENWKSKILNKLLSNRLFLSNSIVLNRFILDMYNKYCLVGDEQTGSRIFIRATKR